MHRPSILVSLALLVGCGSASAEDGAGVSLAFERVGSLDMVATGALLAAPEGADEPDEFSQVAEPEPEAVDTIPAAPAEEPVESARVAEPVAQRIARRTLTVYGAPNTKAPVRGRIPMAKAFDVFGYVEAPGCEGELGWADLGHHGFACMEHTRKGGTPRVLPKLRASELTPYYYAKVRKGESAPRYKNLRAMNAGHDPIDRLKSGVDYAFTIRRVSKGEIVLLDERRRAVREKDVSRFRPSRFQGRDLEANPVSEGHVLAWVSNWPEAPAYSRASQESELARTVDYHDELLVEAADTDGWYKLADGSFLHHDDVRVFVPPAERPVDVGAGDVWVDIDLDAQILSVMLGDAPIYASLVSSGHKSPTPRGLFRIHNKLAVGSMSSSPGADDFYDVQAVPHVQYFHGSFALHSAYWHDAFGRPISHGCVNLSPRDAKYVFSLTTPTLPAGWIHGYESTEHLGTTVRIHDGNKSVPDRRGEVEPLIEGLGISSGASSPAAP